MIKIRMKTDVGSELWLTLPAVPRAGEVVHYTYGESFEVMSVEYANGDDSVFVTGRKRWGH